MYWDHRCAALFGLEGAQELPSLDAVLADHIHPEDHDVVRRTMATAIETRGQFTSEARAMRRDGSMRWVVTQGRLVSDPRGEPVRVMGTILDVTDARRQAEQRLEAFHRATAIAEVAAELANADRLEVLAEIILRGARVLGAQSSALTIFDPGGGPLRLHMTSRLASEVQEHVEYPVEGVEIELDDGQPGQYAAMHGRRVFLADREEFLARFPASKEGLEILNVHAAAALPLRVEGRILGSVIALWDTPHEFVSNDVEVLDALAAQIALSVSRLQADVERSAAVAAMGEANQRLQLLAETGRVLSGTLEIEEQIEQLVDLVVPELGDWCWIVVTDEQGRLYDLGSAHRDPSRRDEVESYVRAMVSVMTESSGAHVVTATGGPW